MAYAAGYALLEEGFAAAAAAAAAAVPDPLPASMDPLSSTPTSRTKECSASVPIAAAYSTFKDCYNTSGDVSGCEESTGYIGTLLEYQQCLAGAVPTSASSGSETALIRKTVATPEPPSCVNVLWFIAILASTGMTLLAVIVLLWFAFRK